MSTRSPRDQTLPLSFAQERLWFLDQLEPGNTWYNILSPIQLEGDLDCAALQRALCAIVQRHEVLRSSFPVQHNRPVQRIRADANLPLPLIDLSGLADADRTSQRDRLIRQELKRPFDLSRGPLIRAALVIQKEAGGRRQEAGRGESRVQGPRSKGQGPGGSVHYRGVDLLEMAPEERAVDGLFLAFQYPVEIPGVANSYFMKAALNAARSHRGEDPLDGMDFLEFARDKMKFLDFDEKLLHRSVNEGFSGGEKKRNEILQMAILEPRLAILDETDSGLDIDALRVVASGVNALRSPERSTIMITHYQRLLDYVVPNFVHVLAEGRIATSGGAELAHELEKKGYSWLESAPDTRTATP